MIENITKPYILQLKEIGEFQDYEEECLGGFEDDFKK